MFKLKFWMSKKMEAILLFGCLSNFIDGNYVRIAQMAIECIFFCFDASIH